jgi:hypothetical protein
MMREIRAKAEMRMVAESAVCLCEGRSQPKRPGAISGSPAGLSGVETGMSVFAGSSTGVFILRVGFAPMRWLVWYVV